jgi:hypothetical protein
VAVTPPTPPGSLESSVDSDEHARRRTGAMTVATANEGRLVKGFMQRDSGRARPLDDVENVDGESTRTPI